MVTRLVGQPVDQGRRAGVRLRQRTRRTSSQFEHATLTTTGAPVLLKNINDYLTGGMLTLGAIAIAIMTLILMLLFRCPVAAAPAASSCSPASIWAFGIAGYIGIPLTIVTIAGLPVMLGIGIDYSIQMHARVEEEVIIARAPHPIQETVPQSRAGAPRRDVRRDLRLRRAALRQGADAAAVRSPAHRRCRGDLPEQHHRHARGARHSRSTSRRRRATTSVRARSAVSSSGSDRSRRGPRFRSRSPASSIFAGGLAVEGKLVLQTDPIQWVNQKSQVIKDLHVLDYADRLVERARRVRRVEGHVRRQDGRVPR